LTDGGGGGGGGKARRHRGDLSPDISSRRLGLEGRRGAAQIAP